MQPEPQFGVAALVQAGDCARSVFPLAAARPQAMVLQRARSPAAALPAQIPASRLAYLPHRSAGAHARPEKAPVRSLQHQTADVSGRIAHEFNGVARKALLREAQIPQRDQLANRLRRGVCNGKNAIRSQPHLNA